ncbi:MAG: alpha/beta hydrolase [Verrucomicrobiae bacterium]
MKLFLVPITLLTTLLLAHADMKNAIPLWSDGAPGALGTSSNDIPTLTPYLCESNATGAAMVICPGGGYGSLAPHEGNDYALWLNQHGVTCFVLKYRLGSHGYHHPAMLNDAARAVRWVRAHADDYKIDTKRVGIMGSSAGGHLTATLLTHYEAGDTNSTDVIERQSSRPDLGILCYAVVTMGEFTHQGSKNNLLGKNPAPELVKLLSNELQVTSNTPPCFLWTTFEDKAVPMENTLLFAEALRKNHVPFALHIYEKGGHGMGLGNHKDPTAPLHPWTGDCLFWLREQKFLQAD